MILNKQNWKSAKLGDVYNIQIGKTPPRASIKYWDRLKETRNIWLSIADMNNTQDRFIYDSKEYISNDALSLMKKVKKGTLLVSFKLTLGRLAFCGIDMYTNEAIAALHPKGTAINSEYLYYYFTFFNWDKYAEQDIKVKGKTLNKQKLNKINISYPDSLAEQEAIVDYLDKAFADIEQFKTNAEKNLQNVRELYQSTLSSLLSPKPHWKSEKLGHICSKIGSGATPKGGEKNYKPSGISLVRSMNVHNNFFKHDKLAFIDDMQANELSNVEIFPNDILLNITGASIARCCIVPTNILPARVNQHVSILRISFINLSQQFVCNYLISPLTQAQLLRMGEDGATRQALTKEQLINFSIFYPPTLAEQESIVSQLDALQTEIKRLETHYEQQIVHATALKQSLLSQIFEVTP